MVYFINRIDKPIDDPGRAVTNSAGTDQRQHQIRTTIYTPDTQCLAKIFPIIFWQAKMIRHIKKSHQTDSGIDNKPTSVIPRLTEFPLQQIIENIHHFTNIGEHPADSTFNRIRRDCTVTFGYRLQGISIHGIIERKHLAVEAFPRIVGVPRSKYMGRQHNASQQQHYFFHLGCSPFFII